MCIRRQGQGELLPFDPESERTLNRLCRNQREAHQRNLAVMQNQKEHDQGQERNELNEGHNRNNGRNYASRPVILPDDPYMLLEEFSLPPTVVQSAIQRPPHTSEQLRIEDSNRANAS